MSAPAIESLELPGRELTVSPAAVARYLGMGRTAPQEETAELIARCIRDVQSAARCRACWTEVPVRTEAAESDFGALRIPGASLAKNLAGCSRAILFAATIGAEPDAQRRRAAVTHPSRAAVLDAAGTAAVEAFCDVLCGRWRQTHPTLFLRPRFSPGYGDVPLAVQRELLPFLDSGRRAGICLTDALLMVPQKSVSAVVGLGEKGCTAGVHDCALCSRTDCAFRL
jgi:hypothetical protein